MDIETEGSKYTLITSPIPADLPTNDVPEQELPEQEITISNLHKNIWVLVTFQVLLLTVFYEIILLFDGIRDFLENNILITVLGAQSFMYFESKVSKLKYGSEELTRRGPFILITMLVLQTTTIGCILILFACPFFISRILASMSIYCLEYIISMHFNCLYKENGITLLYSPALVGIIIVTNLIYTGAKSARYFLIALAVHFNCLMIIATSNCIMEVTHRCEKKLLYCTLIVYARLSQVLILLLFLLAVCYSIPT
jgi:hypothetical protein